MTDFLEKIRKNFRYGLMIKSLLNRLAAIGIIIEPYYWIREELKDITLPKFKGNLEDYFFEFLGPKEIKIIAEMKEKIIEEREAISWLKDGKKCFGVKHLGKIAAYCWIDLDCRFIWNKFQLSSHEAYLFYSYTMKAYRGKNIAPYLRFEIYRTLRNMGRNTVYSITEYFNSPAIRFKKKLNAKFLKLGLHIELFKKYKWNWIIKEYKS